MQQELTQAVVEEWLRWKKGRVNLKDMYSEHNVVTPEARSHLRVIMWRCVEKGIVQSLDSKDGVYRIVDKTANEILWQSADPKNIIRLKFPFEIHKYARIYPKSVVIVAGSKQSGKTGFLMNTLVLNMGKFEIDFFNSETGPEQMRERFDNMEAEIPSPAPFRVFERYDNFADIIDPDKISIIDYLDLNSEVYMVGEEIDRIFRKLKQGVAIIGLQKPPPTVTYMKGVKKVIERDLAYGGGFTAKRAILYITLSTHRLKLLYVKAPADSKVNPENMQWSFHFDDTGTKFLEVKRYYESELDEGG